MRRCCFLFALCACLLLCGCQTAEAAPETAAFSAHIEVKMGAWSAAATVERVGIGQLRMTCTAPPSLAGFSVSQNGDSVTLSKEGLTTAFSQGALPEAAPFLRLCRVLDTVSLCTKTPANGRVEGVCNDTPYTLSYDYKTGALCELCLPKEEFSVTFSDFCADLW